MSTGPPFDPRAIANLLLDVLAERERRPTHIDLQKLLYFAHGRFLMATGKPLVSGYFEAWQFGPVHPGLYASFKRAGDRPIDFRALRTDLVTGETTVVAPPDSLEIRFHVEIVATVYGELSTSQLVKLSHASKAPWDQTVKRMTRELTLGARISNAVIKEWFQRHKIDIGSAGRSRGPSHDAPLTRNRPRQYRGTAAS